MLIAKLVCAHEVLIPAVDDHPVGMSLLSQGSVSEETHRTAYLEKSFCMGQLSPSFLCDRWEEVRPRKGKGLAQSHTARHWQG